ncbi:MAG: FGGY family carbohydrate kinase [Acidimicrobiales bacterium]|jgi:sugar (pentulose or hexulose) kinase
MTKGRLYVGLDLGTSGLKGVALAENGSVVARAQATYPTRRPSSSAAEQNPADWLRAAESVAADMAGQTEAKSWGGIGLSGMIPTLAVIDASGHPDGPGITWEDGRAERQGERLRDLVGAEDLYRSTGQWLDGRYLLPMFQRLAEEERPRAERAAKICSAKDYLFSHLTGELVTDPSTASGFGCFDLGDGAWRPALMAAAAELLPIDLPGLPDVMPSTTTQPLTKGAAEAIGVPAGLPVCLGAADSVLGAHGLGVDSEGEVAYVAGTSSVILGVSSRLVFDKLHRYLVTPMLGEGSWGLEMDLLATGSALAWLASVLTGLRDAAAAGELATRVAPEQAPVFLPYLGGGEQGALWDPDLRGSVIGLELRHDGSHLARALLNGIVLESRRCLGVLEEAGLPASEVHLTGGCAAVPGFDSDLADATGRRVSILPGGDTDASAAGAAMLAAQAIDGLTIERAPETDDGKPARTVEPDEARREVWNRLFARHERALAAVRHFRDDSPGKEETL